jgi:hypothetical protein
MLHALMRLIRSRILANGHKVMCFEALPSDRAKCRSPLLSTNSHVPLARVPALERINEIAIA